MIAATGQHTPDETKWYQKDGDTSNHYRHCETCDAVLDTKEAHSYSGGTCACGATDPNAGGTCSHSRTEVPKGDATCTAAGYSWTGEGKAYYCATCKKYFDAATSGTEVTVTKTDALGHTIASAQDKVTTETTHTGTCTRSGCNTKLANEAHDTKGANGACSVCGYKATTPPAAKGEAAISEKIYDEITHALTFKLTVTAPADDETWTLEAKEVDSEVKVWTNSETSSTVDDVQKTVSKTEIVVVAHLAAALTDGQKVTLELTSSKLEGSPFSIPYTYKAPAQPTTPTTPSTSIPDAGSVNTPAAAESAIKNIQNSDADKLAEDMGKELTDTSSSASTATIDKLEALDKAVQDQAGITVAVASDSKAPSAISTKRISVAGAALNAEKTSNVTIELQISAPKTERTVARAYNRDAAVQFSMTLTNVVNTKKLAVPVVVTMPVPAGITASRAVVLHYADANSASEVLKSRVSGGTISFVVTGFSDFIITERAEKKTSSGGSGASSSKSTNIPVTVTPTTPAAPANIFTDVPANHSFASQITWARDNGVMGGYSDGSFRPTNPTNRQQLWMVLARLSGASPADMAAAREWAVNSGVSDGTNGEGTLSRQQLVTMLYRYAQSQSMNLEGAADLSTYPDNGSVASYASEALAWAVGKGIVTGTSDGRLNPEGTATRGQFAVMMYRFSHQS